jgi:hypothetical protein
MYSHKVKRVSLTILPGTRYAGMPTRQGGLIRWDRAGHRVKAGDQIDAEDLLVMIGLGRRLEGMVATLFGRSSFAS